MCGSSGLCVGEVLGSPHLPVRFSVVLREPWAIFEARIVLLLDLLSLCSYTIQDHLSKGGTSHSGLGPPSSLTNQEHAAQICQ